MRKRTITVLVGLVIMICLPLSVHSQTYWNLEPVWVKAEPETSGAFGRAFASGDIDNDGWIDLGIAFSRYINLDWWGRIWLFFNNGSLDTIPDLELQSATNPHTFGKGGLSFSDVNGDVIDDLIVAAPEGLFDDGAVYIYFGGDPFDTIPDVVMKGEQSGSSYGCSITSGDVNGDGVNDVIVGAENTKVNGVNDVGRVYIYYGGADIDTIPDIILNGDTVNPGLFGHLVSSGFDLNGDGNIDLAVNAIWDNFCQGRVYVYYGGDTLSPMDTIPDLVIWGTRPGDWFGDPLSVSGDLTNDYFGDLVVGEPGGETHDTVFIYFGGNPMDSTVDVVLSDVVLSGKSGTAFGNAVSGSQDVNGDGYYDLVVGACHWGPGIEGKGRVYIYCGNDPFPTTPSAFATGAYNSQEIGWRVASAGDVDGDGKDEIMFSNYAGYGRKVWVCRYTGAGMEESENQNIRESDYQRLSAHPNPFTTSTTITLSSAVGKEHKDEGIQLKIYDICGRFVRRFPTSLLSHRSSVVWDGKDNDGNEVRSGVYFVKLEVRKEKSKVEKVMRVR